LIKISNSQQLTRCAAEKCHSLNNSAPPCNWPIRQFKKGRDKHSPYSPDLAPSNFHLFGPQNKSLGDTKFKNDEDVLQQDVQKFLQVPIKNLML